MVPRLIPPGAWKASSNETASGSAPASNPARQSVGTTSKPAPLSSTTWAATASPSRASTASRTVASPVTSR